MTPREAIDRLKSDLQFEPKTAQAYIHAEGLCEYCGQELIFNRLGYACAQIDHLLPRAKYSQQITDKQENYVLSCSLCNGLKRDESILKPDEDPETMLDHEKEELIKRAKTFIEEKIQEPDELWNQAKAIFVGLGLDRSK